MIGKEAGIKNGYGIALIRASEVRIRFGFMVAAVAGPTALP